ncbi:UDP-glucuronosyltransferase 2C1-like isoform X3 [Sphaeramia orbicularis]|uniref:UDP-glucuronosyltransferase 2C1-like isoform X2 n=1 Tax=Sphaeramia orbicularis TaxID=375764 RepID=UPI00117CDD89|nr:UDP-glucuronosyltransferase 2C1-like isoform X2 [Sphaeramia orbicularis]XP_030018380.1 UDP-glucuronosyltransferase 2C1-like isoform X2 [Sphaeramia orbicularis]XP_030018387.1 UDP-glucuronosyltransferase 2C1-like isoform X3 [Sphaeramia orbicularis]
MRLIYCCGVVLLLTLFSRVSHGGNILVFPIEGSHWVNMEVLLRALHSKGHNLTIVRNSKTWYVEENSTYYHSITVPVERSLGKEMITDLISTAIDFERGALPVTSFFNMAVGMMGTFIEVHRIVGEVVSAIFDDQELLRKLKDSNFDLVLTDPCWGHGIILAKYLNLPLVYDVRWLITREAHFSLAPSPLSYIPITGTGNTDKMTFLQRVKNVMMYLIAQTQHHIMVSQTYQKLCEKYLGPNSDFNELSLSADLWLMRVDFVFEYPRPTVPNFVYMGGFQCTPAKALPQQLEDFVQSSGEHGVILMSMGSFVSALPADMTNEIAAAFAKLPQKVIWRHKGDRPANLGNNTLLVDWMPQNDLLGHPKMKLFIAHGGTNGVQEALYHGIPVVGIPLFFDQYDNLLRLKERGGAQILELSTVDKDNNFLKAVEEVLNDPSYRMNMQRLSRLHRDQPMKPLDNALFWIEFVMRHKGAAHLRTESYRMPWYSYHSVDVMLFLSGLVLITVGVVVGLIRCLWSKLCLRTKRKRD